MLCLQAFVNPSQLMLCDKRSYIRETTMQEIMYIHHGSKRLMLNGGVAYGCNPELLWASAGNCNV